MARTFLLNSLKILELDTSASIASLLNFLRIKSVTSGNPVEIEADGIDTDIDLNLKTKGAGQVLVNGTPISGVPGGSNKQIQYNNAGAFGGDAGFIRNGPGDFFITGILRVDDITFDSAAITAIGAPGNGTLNNFTIDGGSF